MYTKLQGICAYITETERGTHTHTHVAGASFQNIVLRRHGISVCVRVLIYMYMPVYPNIQIFHVGTARYFEASTCHVCVSLFVRLSVRAEDSVYGLRVYINSYESSYVLKRAYMGSYIG